MAIPTVNTAGIWNRLAYQGDTHVWSFTVLDATGDPVDLSGAVVTTYYPSALQSLSKKATYRQANGRRPSRS